MSMRHDLTAGINTARSVEYRVSPAEPTEPFVAPVVLTVDAHGPMRLQDYLTADEAERLAQALLDGARKARELEEAAAPREHDRYCISSDPDHDGPCPTEPTDDELYNRPGMEGGISYPMSDTRDEHDPSL